MNHLETGPKPNYPQIAIVDPDGWITKIEINQQLPNAEIACFNEALELFRQIDEHGSRFDVYLVKEKIRQPWSNESSTFRNGTEIIRHILSLDKEAKIIGLSEKLSQETEEQLINAGASICFTEENGLVKLVQVINSFLPH